ncbi:hypothetical protein ACIOD2_42580 [Amycolatopsis sp. NPDC088138]|uniref:hypothetical protein n=1 Tax=Amycolatopsis sp. NPDC088138 TaxID=3363938 RepID=UPI0038033AB9
MAKPQLRSAVLARAWQRIPGVAVLSSADGGPLTRTVKKIVDPLVVRTAARPRLGRPLLDEDAAAELTGLLLADAFRLQATAEWFTHLKRQRRALRITAGNVQDVCFPLAYELATGFGAPGPEAPETAAAALRDLHGEGGGAGVDELAGYLADPRVAADLTEELHRRWQAATPAPKHDDDALPIQQTTGGVVVPVSDSAGAHTTAADRPLADPAGKGVPQLAAFVETLSDSAWRALARSAAGHTLGLALRQPGGAAALERAVREISGLDTPDLGLQRGDHTAVPPLSRRDETTADLLERSVERRVRATLKRTPAEDRPPVAELVDDELGRVAAGFGLGLPALAGCFALGVVVAPALRPLDGAAPAAIPEFARRLNAQVAREGYVLHARRALAGDTPLTPRPDPNLVRELREFAKQFLGRLWIRLHGFDVRGDVPADAADVRDLVTGVVRSTSLDLRTKVRRALVARLPELEAAS